MFFEPIKCFNEHFPLNKLKKSFIQQALLRIFLTKLVGTNPSFIKYKTSSVFQDQFAAEMKSSSACSGVLCCSFGDRDAFSIS
jgi:hypothetical protein